MQDYRRNVKVGLFVIFGLVCLGILIILYGELPDAFGSDTYEVTVRFEVVSGVQEGTPIFMQGIRIGQIARTKFVDAGHPEAGVEAVAQIEEPYTIPSTAYAQVATQPFGFSRPTISLILSQAPTEDSVPKDGLGMIRGETVSGLSSLIPPEITKALDHVSRLAERLEPVADDLHQLLEPRSAESVDNPPPGRPPLRGNLSSAAARLDQALKHINTVLGDERNQKNLQTALDNFKAISEDGKVAVANFRTFSENAGEIATKIKGIADKAEVTLDHTSEQLDDTFRAIIDDAGKLGHVLDHLDKAGRDLAEGRGTAGLLLRDPRLYEELTVTAQRLSAAIEKFDALLKQWQEQGIDLKGFGF